MFKKIRERRQKIKGRVMSQRKRSLNVSVSQTLSDKVLSRPAPLGLMVISTSGTRKYSTLICGATKVFI